MQKPKLHILSTRPLPEHLVTEAARHNITIDEQSFIEIKKFDDTHIENRIRAITGTKCTVVFTSMNAVEIVSDYIDKKPPWNIYSIGNTTRKLIEEKFGKETIRDTAEYAEELADKIIQHDVKEVVFFCGNIRRDALPGKLKSSQVKVDEIIVYETIETAQVIEKKYDAILFYSPSAVQSFFSVNTLPGNTELFVIGKTTAEAIKQYTPQNVIIAETTGKEELVRQAINYFSKQKIN